MSVIVAVVVTWVRGAAGYPATAYTQGHLSFPCIAGSPVTVLGAAGPLAPGEVVTGEDVRGVVIENGVVRVTYEYMAQFGANPPTRELGAHMLYRWDPGADEYRKAFLAYADGAGDGLYGDWTYWANPFTTGATEAHVLRATEDVVEVAFVWPSHRLDIPGLYDSMGYVPPWCTSPPCTCAIPGCGPVETDSAGNAISQAPHCGPACFRRVRSVALSKVIRVERCAPGYFAGYHSVPGGDDAAMGEQEIGTGWGSAVSWSSAGVVVRNPGQTAHQYLGIDDPPPPYAQGAEQAEGPWWVADIPYNNRSYEFPFVRFIALEHLTEVGVWSFGAAQTGALVVHYTTDEIEPTSLPGRYQVFVGAVPYVSPGEVACQIPGLPPTNGPEPWRCFPTEPTPAATNIVTNNLPLTWPN